MFALCSGRPSSSSRRGVGTWMACHSCLHFPQCTKTSMFTCWRPSSLFPPYSMAAARAAKHPGSCILQVGEGGTERAVDPGTSIFIPFTCTFPRTPADTTKGLCHIFAWLPISTSSLLCTQMSFSPIQEVIKVASPTQEVFKVAFPTQEVVQWLLWMSLRIPG